MQHLLEHFKDLTLLPKNAGELKGLILQLAVQGKLTKKWREENPVVESAEKLLNRIKKYNAEQLAIKGRRLKTTKLESDVSLDLPDNWTQVKNHELFSLQKGTNPKDLSESVKTYSYQDIEALDRGNVRRYSDDKKAPKCTDDDILVVCDGSRSGLILEGKFGIVGSTLAIIQTPPFIKDYIKIIFLQDFQRANENMIGAAIPHLDTKHLLQETIGFPPLEEQKAIVAKVNQLFAEVELLEAATKKRIQLKEDFVSSALRRLSTEDTASSWGYLQPHFKTFFTEKSSIKKLREGILQLAVQGKLTRDFRKNHPELCEGTHSAEALLERIKAEKDKLIKEGKIKKEKPLPAITADEIPYELPDGWVWCRLGDLLDSSFYGPRFGKEEYVTNGIPTIRTTDMDSKGYIKLKNPPTIQLSEEKLQLYKVLKGDLLVTRTGSIGTMAIFNEEYDAIPSAYLIRFRFILVEIEYVFNLLHSPYGQRALGLLTNTLAQPNINATSIRDIPFSLPPQAEQKSIIQKIHSLMSLCDRLEKEIETQKTTQEEWMQSCLREVFEG